MIRICLILFAAVFSSCNQHSENKEQVSVAQPTPVVKDNFVTGSVIPIVSEKVDAGQTYALYLPKGYSDSTKLPCIIFFDPHGDGTVPLNLYKDLADKYNYVLMGSNTSKNGVAFEITNVLASNLIGEAYNRFSVDQNKICLCGFSGGAKVALQSGSTNPLIKTIIYSGSKIELTPNHPITVLGIAGTNDMNYTDLVSFDWDLSKTPIKHYLIEWNGKHEFPSAEVFNDAFEFLNTGSIPNYDKKKVTTTKEKVEEEQNIKKTYVAEIQSKDLDWWKKEIADLNTKKKNSPMHQRLLGFLSLAGYSFSNSALNANNLEMAGKVLAIYKMADPDNRDCDSLIRIYNQKKVSNFAPPATR